MIQEKVYLEKDRIQVFIGKEGTTKSLFEKQFNCEIEVNSDTGEVLMSAEDSYPLFIMSNIVAAINYGHNPQNALLLEDEHMVLDIIDVKNLVRNQSRLKSVMGRVIGSEGSTRKAIEEITKCNVSVRDHFVSVIGPFENVHLVHDALDMLIKGASHKTFYSYLERNKA